MKKIAVITLLIAVSQIGFSQAFYPTAGGQMMTMVITFLLMSIPFIFLNVSIAKRKGKSPSLYGWLSIIPGLSAVLAFYLISLTSLDVLTRLDEIEELIKKGNKTTE